MEILTVTFFLGLDEIYFGNRFLFLGRNEAGKFGL